MPTKNPDLALAAPSDDVRTRRMNRNATGLYQSRERRLPSAMAIAVALTLGTSAALTEAAVTIVPRTWVGDGGTFNWSNENNWDGNTDIPLDGSASIFFADPKAGKLQSNIQNLLGLKIYGLTYNANVGKTIIGGTEAITIQGGGITNNSGSLQTINAPVVIGATQTWNRGTGGLVIGGGLTFASGLAENALTLAGTGTFTSRGDLQNNSANLQSLDANVVVSSNQVWRTGSAGLSVRGLTLGAGVESFHIIGTQWTVGGITFAEGLADNVFTAGIKSMVSTGNIINNSGVEQFLGSGKAFIFETIIGNAQTWDVGSGGVVMGAITFGSGLGANALTLAGTGTLQVWGNIINSSGQAQTLMGSNIEANGRITWDGGKQGLTIQGLTLAPSSNLTLLNASVSEGSYFSVSGNSTLNVGASASLEVKGKLEVGVNTKGTLNISEGGRLSSQMAMIGVNANSSGQVTVGKNSTWTNGEYQMYVGVAGVGRLSISDGGTVTSTYAYIGYDYVKGASGAVTITGADSKWTIASQLAVGYFGIGRLDIADGGFVSSTESYIGANATGSGIVTVTGKNSATRVNTRWEPGLLYVGSYGTGRLDITDGGTVSGAAYLGYYATPESRSSGTVTVTGNDAKWEPEYLHVGYRGDGKLEIANGGAVIASKAASGSRSYIGTVDNGNGTVTVGTDSYWDPGILYVGFKAVGKLDITGGGAVSGMAGSIGTMTGSSGIVTVTGKNSVTGEGSTWIRTSSLTIGDLGKGSLIVDMGGVVESAKAVVGNSKGGEGSVTVTGQGSKWTTTLDTTIAASGNGTLDISDGGYVSSGAGFVGGDFGIGKVTVSGSQEANSTWEVATNLQLGLAPVFPTAISTLTIFSGGLVSVGKLLQIGLGGDVSLRGGTLQIGRAEKAQGTYFNWYGGTLRIMGSFSLGAGLLDAVTELSSFKQLQAGSSFTVGAGNQLRLAGGVLGGDGALVNDGSLTGFGSITGSGGFTNSKLLAQSGGNLVLSNTGANSNTGNWDLPTGLQLQLAGTTTLVNYGFLNLNSGEVSGTGTLNNAADGVIGGRGAISVLFSNSGALAVGSGTTSITRAFTNSGQIQLSSNAALLSGGAITNTGRIEGLGRVSNTVTNNGTVEAIGGTLTFTGNLTNTANGAITAGNGAKVLMATGLASNAGQIQLAGGTFDNNGAALTNASTGVISGFGTLRGGAISNDGQVLLSGGTSAVRANVVANSGSQIVLSGNSNTTFYGTVEMKSGAELHVSQGSVATFFGQVNQRNGALVTGTGAKNYEAGFAVGNSPGLGTDAGNVNFGATNVYEAEIGGVNPGGPQGAGIQFDRYVVAGKLTFGGTLKVVQYNGFAPQAGQSFDLFDWGTSEGQFASVDFTAAPLANGLAWDTSHLYADGTLSVAAVPEPGTYAMFAAGLGLMGFMVRRRRAPRPTVE